MPSEYTESRGMIKENIPTPTPTPTPELQSIFERLQKSNSHYAEMLYTIEDKLHTIVDLRTPPSESKISDASPVPKDFIQSMHMQLTFSENLNDRLQRVLDHVKKITG